MAFFSLSKIFWGIFAPSHVLALLVLAAAVCLAMKRRRSGRWLAISAAVLLAVIGVLPTNRVLLHFIEKKYSEPARPAHADGILTLGGGESDYARLVKVYELARRYPDAVIVFSGGSGLLLSGSTEVDSQNAKKILTGLGLDPGRLILEDRSRNTWENLVFSQKIIKPKPGQVWILATSALQLPRAMEVSNRLHWKLLPWPTDYLPDQYSLSDIFDIPENLTRFDDATHEWIGLYAYRLSGKASPTD